MKKAALVKPTHNIKDKIAAVNKANQSDPKRQLQAAAELMNHWVKFYNVQYHKKSFKKMTVKNDGFFVVGEQYSILVTDDSKQIGKAFNKTYLDLKIGDKFSIDLYQGEILEDLDIKMYTSGNAFLNLQANVNKLEKTQKKLNSKKEEEEINQYAPQNGVDLAAIKLEEGDLLIHNNKKDHFAYLEAFLATQLQRH